MTRFMRYAGQPEKYDGRVLSESMRDLDSLSRGVVGFTPRVLEQFYVEPMWLGGMREAPLSIVLVRIQKINDLDAPVTAAGPLVHWVWDGASLGARITKIQGLTVTSPPTSYRYTFLVAERSAR